MPSTLSSDLGETLVRMRAFIDDEVIAAEPVLRSMTLRSDGFGIEPELTAKIFKRGYRVYEIPITYAGRGYNEGKKITWEAGFVALWRLKSIVKPRPCSAARNWPRKPADGMMTKVRLF